MRTRFKMKLAINMCVNSEIFKETNHSGSRRRDNWSVKLAKEVTAFHRNLHAQQMKFTVVLFLQACLPISNRRRRRNLKALPLSVFLPLLIKNLGLRIYLQGCSVVSLCSQDVEGMCGVEHVRLSVLRLEIYTAVEYMARTCLIKADIMMTERVCLVSLSDGDYEGGEYYKRVCAASTLISLFGGETSAKTQLSNPERVKSFVKLLRDFQLIQQSLLSSGLILVIRFGQHDNQLKDMCLKIVTNLIEVEDQELKQQAIKAISHLSSMFSLSSTQSSASTVLTKKLIEDLLLNVSSENWDVRRETDTTFNFAYAKGDKPGHLKVLMKVAYKYSDDFPEEVFEELQASCGALKISIESKKQNLLYLKSSTYSLKFFKHFREVITILVGYLHQNFKVARLVAFGLRQVAENHGFYV
ncbi:hypothetical protein LXL04_025831 [Taraxacum kok-saghyz]